jgi:hypothetical protein
MSIINTVETNLSDMVGSVVEVSNSSFDTMKYLANACRSKVEKISDIVQNKANKFAKYSEKQYENMLNEVRESDSRLQWHDKNMISSPIQVANEIVNLQKVVKENNLFHQMTEGFTVIQKDILATKIASENSPVSCKMMNSIENCIDSSGLSSLVNNCVKDFASEVLINVRSLISETADNVGFSKSRKDLKETQDVFDSVFTDEKGRRLSAYCKLNAELNPVLAIDLEGFDPLTKECEIVMERIEKYFQSKGMNLDFNRKKHYQPQGILRQRLMKSNRVNNEKKIQKELGEYFQGKTPQAASDQTNKAKR